jgi:hypothetical protein
MFCMTCVRFRLILVASEDGQLRPNSSRAMALGSTQPLTEMSARNLPPGKGVPARKADDLTAMCVPIV